MGNGSFNGMRTTIDSGGRVVIPKKMRDYLGLVAGSEVEIEFDGARTALRVEPAVARSTVTIADDGYPVINAGEPTFEWTSEQQRELLEAVRDRRL
jgi:AbrB family looped-hinge helix DNA binding protein